ncbi:MAG: ATPase [Rhizobiaceae bacterium]|nr:ATPase [Rhizobiaceae bacterium]
MREILNDLESGSHLSDADPTRRAQNQMRAPLPKRFYKSVALAEENGGVAVHLDGRQVRTPGRAAVILPNAEAARLVADEFDAQANEIDPVSMPVTRLVNTAIDGVANESEAVLEDILRFASSDMLCYRADSPEGLVERQNEMWDPVLEWSAQALHARLALAEGVMHVKQSPMAIQALRIHLANRLGDEAAVRALRLAALHVITALTGSALLALAVEAGEIDAEQAWLAAHVDEDWQIEHWGQDAEALARRNARHRDFSAAVKVLKALRRWDFLSRLR